MGEDILMSSPPKMAKSSQDESNQLAPYYSFDWENAPLPPGMTAIIKRPKYDPTFDVAAMMREAGYPGTFRIPKCLVSVRRRLDLIPRPRGEVVAVGGFRGQHDYLEFLRRDGDLGGLSPDSPCGSSSDTNPGSNMNSSENGNSASSFSEDMNNNVVRDKGTDGRNSRKRKAHTSTTSTTSMSNTPLFDSPEISQNSASSVSVPSSGVSSIANSTHNIFTPPSGQVWPHSQKMTLESYLHLNGYDPMRYNHLSSAFNTMTDSANRIQDIAEHAFMNRQATSADQGSMALPSYGNMNGFYSGNVENPESLPLTDYTDSVIYKSHDAEYDYESEQLYRPILPPSLYQLRNNSPTLRTLAGGECSQAINFDHQHNYNSEQEMIRSRPQYQYNTTPMNQYANYGMHPDVKSDEVTSFPNRSTR